MSKKRKLAKALLGTYQALNKGNLLSARVNFSQVLETLDEDLYSFLEELAKENNIDLETISKDLKSGDENGFV